MALTWFLPPASLLVGALFAWVLLGRIAATADEVARGAGRFDDLRAALVPIRAEVDRSRAAIDRFDRQ